MARRTYKKARVMKHKDRISKLHMDARRTKKKAMVRDKDRISKFPDDLIHQIMLFMDDIRLAVQTSVLSKRWKLLWTTLPFLSFNAYFHKKLVYYNTLNNVFSARNDQSRILKLDLNPCHSLSERLVKKFVNYSFSHHVECLNVRSHCYCSLSVFSSNSLKELKLEMKFEDENVMKSVCWTLPNLTTLYWKPYNFNIKHKFPESWLTCLPALTTLGLNRCVLPDAFSLPGLKILCLSSCTLPQKVWNLQALLTLQLTNVSFPDDMSEYFVALGSLRNLTIDFGTLNIRCCEISCSQLVNLKIRALLNTVNASEGKKIVVWAPKLCSFSAIGFFRTTFKYCSELKDVNVKFWDKTIYKNSREPSWILKRHRDLFEFMFSELGSAEILSVDLVTLQAFSEISDILGELNSPFHNLKYLKLPHEQEESCLSSPVRQYLLGGSPSATIVKT